jgi:adenine-specific DNA methylase
MKRTIVNPHWTNNARTKLSAEYHYDDGRVLTVSMSKEDRSNPDLAEIYAKFTTEEINTNTNVNALKVQKIRLEEHQGNLAKEERRKNEELYVAKLALFEIDVVSNSTNSLLKSQIRKSKTVLEANAWAVGLMMDELNKKTTSP